MLKFYNDSLFFTINQLKSTTIAIKYLKRQSPCLFKTFFLLNFFF